jgi:hypothetical protein
MKLKLRPLYLVLPFIAAFSQLAPAADLQFAWNASTSSVLAGYLFGYGTTSGQYANTIDVGNVTTYTVSGLASGTYYFAVKAYGTSGQQSGYSNEVTATVAPAGDTTPPVISSVHSSNVTPNSATILWTTSESANSQILYGTTASYGSSTVLDPTLVTSHSQTLTGLAAATTYHCQVLSKDAAGNLGSSADFTLVTASPSDTTPPAISGVASSGVTATAATISWTTSENADTQVYHGTTTSYGQSTTLATALGTSHSQSLSGLTSDTTYHYQVRSRDAAGNLGTSSDYTFKTPDVTPPVISAVAASNVADTTATISWTTNESSDSQVEYGTTTSYGKSTTLATALVAAHSQSLSGLTPGATWHYRVKSKDVSGNLATSSDYTFTTLDTTAPTISSVAASSVTTSSATISWTTNESSDTQVEYGTTTAYGQSTTLATSMVTAHSQALAGLASNTAYYYRVKSRDAAGNLATSTNYTFSTPDATPPVISAVAASNVADTTATITWTTNESSDSQVEYGTTTSYGKSTTLATALVTAHSQSLSGLTPGAAWHYRVKSKDASGNLATSSDYTFTTPDTTAPAISAVSASSVTATAATISWTTDENSDSQVEYGTTTAYGSSTTASIAMVPSHLQSLSGLAPSTTYNYHVKSKDAAGNLAASGNYTFTTTAGIDISTGLAAAFSFDEGAGTTSADFSGNGNTATIKSASWTAGKYGSALSFSGTGYVSAGVSMLPAVNQPKTISFWAYLLSKSTSVQSMLSLANVASRASVQYGYKSSQSGVMGYGDRWIAVGKLPSLKAWHHIGYVYTGTQHRLYVDGTLVGTSTIVPVSASVASFQIGRSASRTEYFKGSIDDVRVYSRALTQDELKAAMNTPVGSVTGIGQASAAATAAYSEMTVMAEPVAQAAEVASQPTSQPAASPRLEIQLDKQAYRPGETVSVERFHSSGAQGRDVEVKTWMSLPGVPAIPLDLDPGATPILEIAADAPAGAGEVNARLVDAVTGDVLAEKSRPFTIGGRGARSVMPAVVPGDKEDGVVLERFGDQYVLSNRGTSEVTVELKVWMETPGGAPASVLSGGADSSLVLQAGAVLTLDSLSDSELLRARVLDAVSGDILGEK